MLKHIVFDHDGTLVKMGAHRDLYPGIKELLTELLSREIKIYVWTARNRVYLMENQFIPLDHQLF